MHAPLKNDLFLRALLRKPVPRTPMWIMRQAGRYLPEYRATRAEAGDFMSLCSNPELACEVTLQPLRRYRLDAAILFSDILTVPDAMGLGLYFETGEGPKFRNPVRSEAEIRNLAVPDIAAELGYVTDAVSLIRRELDGMVRMTGNFETTEASRTCARTPTLPPHSQSLSSARYKFSQQRNALPAVGDAA